MLKQLDETRIVLPVDLEKLNLRKVDSLNNCSLVEVAAIVAVDSAECFLVLHRCDWFKLEHVSDKDHLHATERRRVADVMTECPVNCIDDVAPYH